VNRTEKYHRRVPHYESTSSQGGITLKEEVLKSRATRGPLEKPRVTLSGGIAEVVNNSTKRTPSRNLKKFWAARGPNRTRPTAGTGGNGTDGQKDGLPARKNRETPSASLKTKQNLPLQIASSIQKKAAPTRTRKSGGTSEHQPNHNCRKPDSRPLGPGPRMRQQLGGKKG